MMAASIAGPGGSRWKFESQNILSEELRRCEVENDDLQRRLAAAEAKAARYATQLADVQQCVADTLGGAGMTAVERRCTSQPTAISSSATATSASAVTMRADAPGRQTPPMPPDITSPFGGLSPLTMSPRTPALYPSSTSSVGVPTAHLPLQLTTALQSTTPPRGMLEHPIENVTPLSTAMCARVPLTASVTASSPLSPAAASPGHSATRSPRPLAEAAAACQPMPVSPGLTGGAHRVEMPPPPAPPPAPATTCAGVGGTDGGFVAGGGPAEPTSMQPTMTQLFAGTDASMDPIAASAGSCPSESCGIDYSTAARGLWQPAQLPEEDLRRIEALSMALSEGLPSPSCSTGGVTPPPIERLGSGSLMSRSPGRSPRSFHTSPACAGVPSPQAIGGGGVPAGVPAAAALSPEMLANMLSQLSAVSAASNSLLNPSAPARAEGRAGSTKPAPSTGAHKGGSSSSSTRIASARHRT